jgi:endonuclease YncB( thermonuclease family)
MSPIRLIPLLIAVLIGCESDPTYPAGDEPCRRQVEVEVQEFVDGDTVDVAYLGDREGEIETIRLNSIDTPEIDHDDEAASDCWALEAWAAAAEAFNGELAWMTFDTECTGVFDRTLVYLFRESDGLFLNHHLVLEGHSPAFFPDYSVNLTFQAEFLEAEERAASELKGGWAQCGWQLGGVGT